jgi:hypothetical protein
LKEEAMPTGEQTGIELLLSEPEIVAWLEPDENQDDDDEPPMAA